MISKAKIVAAAALTMAASACTPIDHGLGAAVKYNQLAHTVNPEPKYEGEQTASGTQTAEAQDRYRTGRVKRPRSIKTTSGSGG
jgi:hypothetical protein